MRCLITGVVAGCLLMMSSRLVFTETIELYIGTEGRAGNWSITGAGASEAQSFQCSDGYISILNP